MGRRLLPCPVCGGESFIESVTQGGLICTDCGSVSNQVEVAEEEDPQLAPKTFVRVMNYVPVTEEESRMKRDRRKLMRIIDRRDHTTFLHGLGLVLDHMVSSCVQHGLCHSRARESVRQTWFEFLSAVGKHTDEPCILLNSTRNKMKMAMARWGFPEGDEISASVCKDLPPEHAKRSRSLIKMMHDRGIDHSGIRLLNDSQILIYAHDWLCLLFEVDAFPFPDELLLKVSENPSKLTWESIKSREKETKLKTELSMLRRRGLIRRLFSGILLNDSVRRGYMSSVGRKVVVDAGGKKKASVPDIDMRTLLAILVIGIRNSEGGIEPIHVLNWIARCQLPFFSAHTCLPETVDRIEYYRVSRMNLGYKRSVFSASFAPTVKELEVLIENVQLIGVPAKPNHPVGLADTCLDMLGLVALKQLTGAIITGTLHAMLNGVPANFPPGRVSRKMSLFEQFEPIPLFSDIHTCDFVLAAIVVAAKLVFPPLHPESTPSSDHHSIEDELVLKALQDPLEYEIYSRRNFVGEVGDNEWWQKCFSNNEREQFLRFVQTEMLNELRECLAQDVIEQLVSERSDDIPDDLDVGKCIIRSGEVGQYVMCGDKVDSESLLFSFVEDLVYVCNSGSRIDVLFHTIAQLENFLFVSVPGKSRKTKVVS